MQLRSWFHKKSYEEVIAILDPWILSCAVGAFNGSINYAGARLTFSTWLRFLNYDDSTKATGVSKRQLQKVLEKYAAENRYKHMIDALQDEYTKRGQPHINVAGDYLQATANRPDLRRRKMIVNDSE